MAISLCGAVDLLAAIFGEDSDKARQHYGLPLKRIKRWCRNCGKLLVGDRKEFCSPKCYHEAHTVPLECSECGTIFYRRQSQVLYHLNHPLSSNGKPQERFFCNKKCFGRWAGKNYGFVAHPENVLGGGSPRKWDYSKVYELRDSTGWGGMKISRELGIPNQTVYSILKKRG